MSTTCSAIRVKLTSVAGSSYGLVVGKRSDCPPCLVVSSLQVGGEAASSGLLRPGDLILKINGIDVSSRPFSEAFQILQSATREPELRLLIRAPLGYSTHLETTFDDQGSSRTYRVTERQYTVGSSTTTMRGSSGSINLHLDDGVEDTDAKRR